MTSVCYIAKVHVFKNIGDTEELSVEQEEQKDFDRNEALYITTLSDMIITWQE